ncbi:hypothetical protein GmHk_09G024656 [Glycine max]|nr:hypothetical protein GmHk_09G024656 [Glycine max]
MSSANEAMEQEDQIKPLWRYVTKLRKTPGGGNAMIKCNLCEISFIGSYTRVRAHLLKILREAVRPCSKVTPPKIIELKKLDNEATLKIQSSKKKCVSLPGEGKQKQDGAPPKVLGPLEKGFNLQGKDDLDARIARMFFSSGLPFHLARNPYYREALSYAANTPNLSGYKPLGYNKLRTTFLTTKRRHVVNLLQPIRNSWNQKGVTTVNDGWSDPQRSPLINFMAVTESGPMFLKAVNCFGDIKDKDFIAQHIKDSIMEVGSSNVVQIVTNNAVVCDANLIKFFIMGHSMRLSLYNNFNSLKLLSVAPTRFASTVVMLKRYYSHEWLSEDPSRVPSHQGVELTDERKKCFRRYFDDVDVRRQANLEFANFFGGREGFHDVDSFKGQR